MLPDTLRRREVTGARLRDGALHVTFGAPDDDARTAGRDGNSRAPGRDGDGNGSGRRSVTGAADVAARN